MNLKGFFKAIFHLNSLRIGIILTLMMILIIYYRPKFMEAVEAKAYDLRFQARGERSGAEEIVIVAMDERSIEKIGRYPWPRNFWARFFQNLAKYQPKVITLDVVFSEPDQNINLQFVRDIKEQYLTLVEQKQMEIQEGSTEALNSGLGAFISYISQIEEQANTDRVLAQSFKEVENDVLGWFFFQSEGEAEEISREENLRRLELLKPFAVKTIRYKYGADAHLLAKKVPPIYGLQVNLPILSENISSTGYFTAISDRIDGVHRSTSSIAVWPPPEKIQPGEEFYFFPSLSLATLSVYLGEQPMPIADDLGLLEIGLGKYRIPVDESGLLLINYQGGMNSFPIYSFYDVFSDFAEMRKEKNFNPETAFKDKIVLVGPTAVGIYDIRATPFGALPGVFLHANTIDNVLHNRALYRPSWMWGFDLIIITVLGILLSLIYPRVRPLYSAGLVFIFVIGYWWFNYYVFDWLHYSLTVVYPISSVFVVYLGITIYHYTMEEREKRFIRSAFSYYLSPEVIDDLLTNPDKLKLGGDRKEVTIFFSDLQGFTSMSERMPPEQLVALLNAYLTEMSDIIMRFRGTIDKFEGDAIMAFFGAPVDYPDHAISACLASLEMQNRLAELNKKWQKEDKPELICRMGLNTGSVLVGNMGSSRRMDYTIIGDEVNLASRLEGANKAYGTKIMISESAYLKVQEMVEVRELDLIQVVGKERPVRVYELLAKKGELAEEKKELVNIFSQGLELYRKREFEKGLELFKRCLGIDPKDSPSQIYLQRCQSYLEEPPPMDWDGVFRLTKK